MTEPYTREFMVGWGDLDSNSHMKNTAYLDYAATTRFCFFSENGFSASRFQELRFGPVVLKDEAQYFKEMRLLETFRVSFLLDGMSKDGALFRIVNELSNSRGERVASIRTHGAWLDLQKRKITIPPIELIEVMKTLKKTGDYAEIVRQVSV